MNAINAKARPVPGLFVSWPSALAYLSQQDEQLAQYAKRYADLPAAPMGTGGAILSSVCAQQISNRAFERVRSRLFNAWSVSDWSEAASFWQSLSKESADAAFCHCGLSAQKRAALSCVYEKLLTGEFSDSRFSSMGDAAVSEALQTINGIGPWTAQMVLLFGLDRPDVWPLADYGIRTALVRDYFPYKTVPELLRKANADTVQSLVSAWAPYRSAAALLLWRSLENGSESRV